MIIPPSQGVINSPANHLTGIHVNDEIRPTAWRIPLPAAQQLTILDTVKYHPVQANTFRRPSPTTIQMKLDD